MKHAYIAFDLGATSGRTILAHINDNKVEMEVINRFPHKFHLVGDYLHWNIIGLFEQMLEGLSTALTKTDADRISIGVDTWGVDSGLLSPNGEICLSPYAYRDPRTSDIPEEVFKKISQKEIYSETGIQTMHINSIFQLYELNKREPELTACAGKLLFMSDLFNYLLCGRKVSDTSMASTSQLFNPHTRTWSKKIIENLDLPAHLLPDVFEPGVELAPLSPAIAKRLNCTDRDIRVCLIAGHDTASAVAAIPADPQGSIFISSGTWSLLGIISPTPIISPEAEALNYSNEQGVFGTTRFLKNITGMWLLEECRKQWKKDGLETSFAVLDKEVLTAPSGTCIVDPNDPMFENPANMPEAICEYARNTNQREPQTPAEFMRVITESLANAYNKVLEELRTLAPFEIERIHMIGGGSQSELQCQLTADATGLDVYAGPTEATATGNILLQAYVSGEITDWKQAPQISANSCNVKKYIPDGQ
jgi:rhamnulokinase